MKKIVITVFTLFLLIFNTNIFAQISIDQYYLLLDDKTKNNSITVYNRSDEDKNYIIEIVDLNQQENGSYKPVEIEDQNLQSAEPYIIYTPRKFTLKSKENQTIRIQRRNMSTVEASELNSHLKIRELPKEEIIEHNKTSDSGISVEVKPLFAITVPIVLRKGKPEDIVEKRVSFGPHKITESLDPKLELTLRRSGKYSSRGIILVKQKNEVIGELNSFNILMGNYSRTVSIPLKKYNDKEAVTIEYLDEITGKTISTMISRKNV